MTSAIDEAKEKEEKQRIEKQPENREKSTDTATTATTEDSGTTTATAAAATASEVSKKKKKKKKDSSANSETQKVEGGDNRKDEKMINEKDTTNETAKGEQKDTKNSDATVGGGAAKKSGAAPNVGLSSGPVVSGTKRTRPPYKYDPEKLTLRFLFANRDGLTVTVECKPSDTVGEVKGQLLSVWPEDLQSCTSGDQLRLICMGKGMLIPDTRTLEDCEVPVFKTHPTPVNVAVRPIANPADTFRSGKDGGSRGGGHTGGSSNRTTEQSGQGCGCVIS